MEKYIFVFAIFTFCTIVIATLSVIAMKEEPKITNPCTMDDYLKIMTSYISHKGVIKFEAELSENCRNQKPNPEEIKNFRKSLINIINSCNSIKSDVRKTIREPIMTLFTSVDPDPKHNEVTERTLKNWGYFLPSINLVMFTNDTRIAKQSRDHGWSVLPVVKVGVEGLPVLKAMFQQVIQNFSTHYYGYANGDILLTETLLESLSTARKHFNRDENVMLTGRRINVPHLTNKELVSYQYMEKVAKERGKLFVISSEDYFITTKHFAWQNIPDFVIGRPAYDNWLVAHARCNNIKVIDTTNTILAIHQTTDKGDKTGHAHSNANYNDELLVSIQAPRNYVKGFITCPEWYSFENLCGNVEIAKRLTIPPACAC
ncbi:uncharacterized protein LOC110462820 [Mizuhopecten yessoensis]|uniref:Uncharacterized protein n=1 Tax=Mizuhopecten yessoensis TaxID=6573 RepID=A0A210PXG3_MIZYE|nr:uncharacterized protein LOC110462820 [Mizuhopecten yessoensis]OWF41188.1 hypothetical protein KP79_PYT09832 [Mizuhopecten yessoensis]